MQRQELYDKVRKYIYLEDTTVLDVIFAVFLANQSNKGIRLWLFLLSQSGGPKSTLLEPLNQYKKYVLMEDNISPASLISGNPNCTTDLYHTLKDGKPKLQIFLDLSVLSNLRTDIKKVIMAIYKNLYDGFMHRRTANINEGINDAKLGFVAGITRAVLNDKIIFNSNAFGTRQLTFEIVNNDKDKVANICLKNEGEEGDIQIKLKEIYRDFLSGKSFKKKPLTPEIKHFIKKSARELAILRGAGTLDFKGNNYTSADIEDTSRLNKQLSRLYSGLNSLDEQPYPDDRFKQIVKNIIKASAEPTRYQIWETIKNNNHGNVYRVKDFYENNDVRKPHQLISRELGFLWSLKLLDLSIEEEQVCGRLKEVKKYYLSDNGKKLLESL